MSPVPKKGRQQPREFVQRRGLPRDWPSHAEFLLKVVEGDSPREVSRLLHDDPVVRRIACPKKLHGMLNARFNGSTPLGLCCEDADPWSAKRRYAVLCRLLRCIEVDPNRKQGATWPIVMAARISADLAERLSPSPASSGTTDDSSSGSSSAKAPCFLLPFVERPDVNVNAADANDGTTALSYCAQEGYVRGVRALLRRPDLDTKRRDRAGKTAEDYAVANGHVQVARLLETSPR